MNQQRHVERVAAAAMRNDFASALRVVDEVCRQSGRQAARRLLVDVLRLIGEHWLRGTCTIGHGHMATAAVERLSWLLADRSAIEVGAARVVIVCAEGERHDLPARLFADELSRAGWDAWCVPGEVPVNDLAALVAQERPFAVGVSATVARHLAGAYRTLRAVQSRGVPVLVGGAAFGSDRHRAVALGADGWAPHAQAADVVLRAWLRTPPRSNPTPPRGLDTWEDVGSERTRLVEEARRVLRRRGHDAEAVVAELAPLLDVLGVGLLVADERVVVDHLGWRAVHLRHRDAGTEALHLASLALDEALLEARQWPALELLAAAWATSHLRGEAPPVATPS